MFSRTSVRLLTVLSVLILSVALFASDSRASSSSTGVPNDELGAVPNELALAGLSVGPSWTHFGCIQLGSTCFDVFADKKGRLWVCDACFTTNNPSPGQCRRLTSEEIDNALWCA